MNAKIREAVAAVGVCILMALIGALLTLGTVGWLEVLP